MAKTFDLETTDLLGRIHCTWKSKAGLHGYAGLRDSILAQHSRLDISTQTLATVARLVQQRDAQDVVATNDDDDDDDFYAWQQFFKLATLAPLENASFTDNNDQRSKSREYNNISRRRNLAVVVALWSNEVVQYYGWDCAGQQLLRVIRSCAETFPNFETGLVPRLNSVLLDRHCLALLHSRGRTLNEARLQPGRDLDLRTLAAVLPDIDVEDQWLSSTDGAVPLSAGGPLLRDIRPHHYHLYLLDKDQHGILKARNPVESDHCTINESPGRNSSPSTSESAHTTIGDVGADLSSSRPNSRDRSITSRSPTLINEDVASPYSKLPLADALRGPGLPQSTCSWVDHIDTFSSRSLPQSVCSTPQAMPCFDFDQANHNPTMLSTPGSSNEDALEAWHPLFEFLRSPSAPQSLPLTRSEDRRPSINLALDLFGLHTIPEQQTRSPILHPTQYEQSTLTTESSQTLLVSSATNNGVRRSLEQQMHYKHRSELMSYMQQLEGKATLTDQGREAAQWLTASTRWAKIWSLSPKLSPGLATCIADADVFCCTATDMLTRAASGEIFRKPMLIKENFTDSAMHTATQFLDIVRVAQTVRPAVRLFGVHGSEITDITTETLDSLVGPCPSELHGLNVVTRKHILKCHKPIFTMLPRFRLLDAFADSFTAKEKWLCESDELFCGSSVDFDVLGLPAAFTNAYVDTVHGMWVRVLEGIEYWMIVPERDMASEWESFAKQGSGWCPRGRERLLVLEQDDVLFIPPGSRVVRAVHSPHGSLREGATLWDVVTSAPEVMSSAR